MTPNLRRSGIRTLAGLAIMSALPSLTGCLNWQAAYDEAARNQCRALPDTSERQSCMDRAADNSRERRADRRGD
jgi:hypothetical protein